MKVRHFGPPKPAQAPVLSPAGGKVAAPANVEGKPNDPAPAQVTLEAGALQFPRVAGLAENAKVDRARTLLQTLRAPDGDAFGGKVKGGVDVAATLKSYYRALEVAPIALDAGADAAVQKFVASLDVPEDIRPLVAMAAGDVSSSGPLGTCATWERDSNMNAFWSALRNADSADALRVTDATVKAFFTKWGGADLQGVVRQGGAKFQVGIFKLFARAQELGLNPGVYNASAYMNGLPATSNSAAVLLRFAHAFDLDPRELTLGNRPLSQWQPRVPGEPLGTVSAWENDSNAWYNAMRVGDRRAFQVTDATLENLSRDGYTTLDYWIGGPAATHLDAVNAFARFAAITAVDANTVEDNASSLEGSKEIARALQRIGKACGTAVDHVLLGDKTIGAWASGKKAGAPAAAAMGAKKPLGSVSTWERDGNYNQLYNAARFDPRTAMKITDATLSKWFGAWGPNRSLTDYAGDGSPEARVAYAMWWARGKELGLPATCEPANLAYFADSMPPTAEAAAALRRVGRAFGFSVEQHSVGGKRVSSFARARSSAGADAAPTLPARPALGDTKMLKPDLQAALSKKDAALFSIDDGSLKRLLAFDPDLTAALGASRDRAWRIGVLTLADRALALGALEGGAIAALVQHTPQAFCDDATTSELVASLVVKADLSADTVAFSGGEPLSSSTETAAHVTRLQRVLEGVSAELLPRRASPLDVKPGPLGNRQGPYSNYWNRRDPGMFELDDASLRNELIGSGDLSWLGHWNNAPGVISLISRIIELDEQDGNDATNAKNSARAWLQRPIPEMFGTADALPRIIRLCKAVGVDPKDVAIEHKRTRVALLKHPELLRMVAPEKALARAQALTEDLALLAPDAKTRGTNGGPAHPAEREAAVLHLLGVTNADAPILHELAELLPAALHAMQSGALTRLDLKRLPAKHKDAMLATAFQSHDHPAATALLAGMFFQTDAASIEKVLLGQGHLPKIASEMAEVAAQLAKASASELAFCALGLGSDPPELSSLPLRAWMLKKPAPAELLAKIKADPDSAAALAAMVLEEATLKDTAAARKIALLDVVAAAEKQGLVERDSIVELLSDPAKRALDGESVGAVEAAVAALLQARTAAESKAAKAELAAVLGQQTWTNDPNVLAEAALAAAAALDLQFVAPLGAVDIKGGGVVGKAWESRLSQKGPRVQVSGVSLPVESASGRAPKVSVPAYPTPEDSGAEKALQLVATRWLAQRPFSIDDVDGASALRAVAQATGAKLTDVVVNKDTPLEALLGPAGSISAALAAGGAVHVSLRGTAWPKGLGEALGALPGKARVVATGPALAGVPVLKLVPLDSEALRPHGMARGMGEDHAQVLGDVMVALRERTGFTVPLTLIDRVAARMKLIADDGNYTNLQRAISQLALQSLPASKAADVAYVLRHHVNAGEDAAPLTVERRTARLGDVPFKTVVAGVKAEDVPPMTDAERTSLRAAGWALEVREPVLGDARTIEQLGIGYGAMTGRDVHVHLLYDGVKPSDVISDRVGDVVIVAKDFGAAPEATRTALLDAAREGRIRLLIEDAPGVSVDGAFSLAALQGAQAAGVVAGGAPAALADLAVHAREKGRLLGLPDVVTDGACEMIGEIQSGVSNGELAPLMKTDASLEVDNLLLLLSDLMRVMPLADAFVAAVSATYPMTTRDQQDQLEASARAVVDG